MYRRRKQPPKALLIGGSLVLLLVLGGWFVFGSGSGTREQTPGEGARQSSPLPLGPQSAAAAPVQNQTPLRSTARPEPVQPPVAPRTQPVVEAEPPPLELRQGRPDESTNPAPKPRTSSNAPSGSVPVAPVAENGGTTAAPHTTTDASIPSGSTAMTAARQRLTSGDLVTARLLFSRALRETRSETERASIRAELARINDDLVFSRRIASDDPWAFWYTVQSNDSLVRINQRQGLAPDWRLIQRINGMSNPDRLQVGQKLKLLHGPFHAVVSKSAFRLDLYMGPADDENQWLYIRSFPVGLGEGGSTPLGTFVVRRNSKLINPHWINPRTGEHFAADDPKNPIGERWIGLEGIGDSVGYVGYGLHGTIDPASIGRELSMGCVRLSDSDIELVYELLGEQVSVVRIDP